MNSSQQTSWIIEARRALLKLATASSGWGYRQGGMPAVEPTALAGLALLATNTQAGNDSAEGAISSAAQWLASIQQNNGAVGVSASVPWPEWPTSYAILIWLNLRGWSAQAAKAGDWLLQRKGIVVADPEHILGHDATIPGWPWVEGTTPWLEPTAMAVLALRKLGMTGHERTRDGLRLIRNRAIASGGWNYGNNTVNGTELRPQPAPTGIALTALSGTCSRDDVIDKACAYLTGVIPTLRSGQSLSWALLGLASWDAVPPDADRLLREAYALAQRRSEPVPELAYLLLASGPRALTLLGAQAGQGK